MQPNLQKELSLLERLSAPTSPFFKPLLKWGILITALITGLLSAQTYLLEHGVIVPPVVAKILEILGYVSGALAGVSTLTVDVEGVKREQQLDNI